MYKHLLNNKVGEVFVQAWPPPCRFFLLLPLPPSPFQADPLECGGYLLARASETHPEGAQGGAPSAIQAGACGPT